MRVRPRFDIAQSFKALDFKHKRGDVNKHDLALYLEERHYFATEKEIGYLMNRFDKN